MFSTVSLRNERFPFDWKNPVGYPVVCLIEYILELNMSIGTLYSMTFELGSVFMLIWMTKDIKRSLSLINKNATAKLEILQQFKQTIQFYYDAKQLSG